MKKILKALVPTKTPTTPSLGEQYGAALALKGAAVSVFKQAQDDLLQAEAELSEIASEAVNKAGEAQAKYESDLEALLAAHQHELDNLEGNFASEHSGLIAIADMAYDDAHSAYEKAGKLDDLLS